jgi:hypothetical protein
MKVRGDHPGHPKAWHGMQERRSMTKGLPKNLSFDFWPLVFFSYCTFALSSFGFDL